MRKAGKIIFGVVLGNILFFFLFFSIYYVQNDVGKNLNKEWKIETFTGEIFQSEVPFFKYTNESGKVFLRNTFMGSNWKYLVIPIISGNGFRVYVNDYLIGQVGEMENGTPNSWNYTHIFAIDKNILKESNEIKIEIYSLFTYGLDMSPYLSEEETVFDKVGILNFFKNNLPAMGMGAGVLIGIILIILGLSFKKVNRIYVYMGICALLSSLFLSDDIFRVTTFNLSFFLWYRKIAISSGFAATYFFLASIEVYSSGKKYFSKLFLWITLAFIAGLLVQPTLPALAIYGRYAGFIVIANIGIALGVYFRNMKGKEWLLFPLTFLALSIFDYVVLIQILRLSVPNMFSFGLMFINIGFGVILVHHHKKLNEELIAATKNAVFAESIKEKANFLEKLFDFVPFPAFYEASTGEVVVYNKEYEKLHIKRRSLNGMVEKGKLSEYDWYDLVSKTKNKKINREITLQFGEESREYLVSCTTLSGKLIEEVETGVLGVMVDISQRKQTEAYLKEARDKAIEASEMKSRFLANMSHEIRTPMNGIIGMTKILADTKLGELQLEYLNIIDDCSKNLLSLINDVLDISKIEAGKFDLDNRHFDINKTVKDLEMLYGPLIRSDKVKFEVESSEFDYFLIGDEKRLKQILNNLLSNARKFTEKGYVKLIVKCGNVDFEKKDVDFEFIVEDTGKGIARESVEKIFNSFEQEDSSISTKYGGTGLGLAISREFAHLMGGDIKVRSKLGEGSEFSLKVNFKFIENLEKKDDENNIVENGNLNNLKLILAEDNEVNQKIASIYLKKLGIQFDIASNGREVLDLIETGIYDLILMDIKMPIMDGFEVTRKIRQRDDLKGKIKIIALTAHAMDEYKRRVFKNGMNGYITKPFEIETLKKEMLRVMGIKNIENEYEIMKSKTGLDEETFKDVFNEFVKGIPAVLEKIKKSIDEADFDEVYSLVHDLKSNLGYFGEGEEYDLICNMNEMAKDRNSKGLKEAYKSLGIFMNKEIYSIIGE